MPFSSTKKVISKTTKKLKFGNSIHERHSIYEFESIGKNIESYSKYLKDDIWSGKTLPLNTGLPSIDRYLASFPDDGGLLVLGARTSMGKTALALNIAYNIASTGDTVVFISLEMSVKYQLFDRLHSLVAQIKISDLRSKEPNQEIAKKLIDAKEKLKSIPLFTTEGGKSPSVEGIELKLEKFLIHCKKNNLNKPRLIIIDHLGYLRESGQTSIAGNTISSVASITRDICILSKTHKIPILLVSQLSRALENRENKIPRLADLRDSGAVEQDADMVLLLHRPIYHLVTRCLATTSGCSIKDQLAALSPIRTLASILIAKNRSGRTGRINLAFDADFMRFRESTELERQGWDKYGM